MSPTIVVDDEGVLGVLGGSGGPRIITGTLLALIQLIDFDSRDGSSVRAPLPPPVAALSRVRRRDGLAVLEERLVLRLRG